MNNLIEVPGLAGGTKTKTGLTYNFEQRKAVADQFLKDHPDGKTQPTDKLLKEAMQKALPPSVWRKYFAGDDPIKMLIHQAQGTKPVKDPNKSKAALEAARRRKAGLPSARQLAKEIVTSRTPTDNAPTAKGLYPQHITAEQLLAYFNGQKCLICEAEGRDKKLRKPSRQARWAHYFRAHTQEGRRAAKRAGLNFQSKGEKKKPDTGKKKPDTDSLICPECLAEGKTFTSNTTHGLAIHRRFKHGVIGEFSKERDYNIKTGCPYCDYMGNAAGQKRHMEKYHPDETGIVDLRIQDGQTKPVATLELREHVETSERTIADIINLGALREEIMTKAGYQLLQLVFRDELDQ